MGVMKRLSENRQAVRQYNAAKRRAARLQGDYAPRLIRLETESEIERYTMAQDADRSTEYNQVVEAWQAAVTRQLQQKVAVKSLRVAQELQPRAYRDKYGLVNRLGFSFPRHGIWLHKGAGRGQGGWIGSHWNKLKIINGVEIDTGIERHTNPNSINGLQGTGKRRAYEWFDPVIDANIGKLEEIVMNYFDTMIVDASRIYITK